MNGHIDERKEMEDMESNPLLQNNDDKEKPNDQNDKSGSVKCFDALPFLVAMAFFWRFIIPMSKISVQALEDRVPVFQLNAMRCFTVLFVWTLIFVIRRKLPRIEKENIKAAILWSVNHILVSLTNFISVIYIPLASAETFSILSNILTTVIVFVVILRRDGHWSQVSI